MDATANALLASAVSAGAPIAISAINQLMVRLVDRLFPAGSGAQKLPVATEMAAAVQNGLHQAGNLAGTPQSGADLSTGPQSIQATVDALKAKGELKGAATVIDPSAIAAIASASGGPTASALVRSLGNAFAGVLESVGK